MNTTQTVSIRFLHNEPHLFDCLKFKIYLQIFVSGLFNCILRYEKRETVALKNQNCCRNIEPTWLQPEQQLPAAQLQSPTSTTRGKRAGNRRKGGVSGHAHTPLASPIFLRLWIYVTGSSTQCCSHRSTIHSCNRGRSAHRCSLDKNKPKPTYKNACSFFSL